MKLLLISKKVFFKKELFGWFLIWQFVICKSYKKMLIVYAQATILNMDSHMCTSICGLLIPARHDVTGHIVTGIWEPGSRTLRGTWPPHRKSAIWWPWWCECLCGYIWEPGLPTTQHSRSEKIEHPREGGPGVRGIYCPQKKIRSEKIEHPREGGSVV